MLNRDTPLPKSLIVKIKIITLFGVSSVLYLNSEKNVFCCVGSAEIPMEMILKVGGMPI